MSTHPPPTTITHADAEAGLAAEASGLSLQKYTRDLATRARAAAYTLATAPGSQRDLALRAIAQQLRQQSEQLKAANAQDLAAAPSFGLSGAMIDRLRLNDKAIEAMATGVEQVAAQPDPVGRILDGRTLANGLQLTKLRVPIGTILIIFESRPNVTADAAALCLKAGNATILRGGKEALHSNTAIAQCVQAGLQEAHLPGDAVQLVNTTDRAAVGHLLSYDDLLDLCIPRGGESLIRAVVEQARIPVIKHYTGNCHVYVDEHADADMAEAIILNAKTQRTGVCNAAETLLVHRKHLDTGLLKRLCDALIKAGVELRADTRTMSVCDQAKPATDADWAAEYLDMILAVRVVDSLDDAVAHINRFGSKHTDAVVTRDLAAADRFVTATDTANAMINCSTRFSDGFQYGLGAEIGISTDKLHARGPMGADDLCTYKWVVKGNGHVRQ